MNLTAQPNAENLKMRCPSCGAALGNVLSSTSQKNCSVTCPSCAFEMVCDQDGWNACIDKDHPKEFSRQWLLWESGKLGDPNLVYGVSPEAELGRFLDQVNLTRESLKSKRILEVGFGHGTLLRELQKWSPGSYGLDLVKPLRSANLRPHSTIFGSLFRIPFMPGQFDLVLCRGVIHHTDSAAQAFGCIAEQVAQGGTLYLTLYEPGIKGTLLLRNLLPWSWRYPESVRLGISGMLGVFRATLECLRTREIGLKSFARYHGNAKLGIFDVISPRWTSLHPSHEVNAWFTTHGYSVQRLGPGHYVGRKQSSQKE
jgi:SAM-dependent methyltransferase